MCLTYYCCCYRRKKKDSKQQGTASSKNNGNNAAANTTNNNTTTTTTAPQTEQEDAQMQEYRLMEVNNNTTLTTEEQRLEYENLIYIAQKRNVRVTVQKSTQAGIAAGLCVMGGTIIAGPVGALAGGTVGTVMAASIARHVVPLYQLLEQTPPEQRTEVYHMYAQAIRDEFQNGFVENPELRLVMGGGSITSVLRYAMDRNMMEREKLEKLDALLKSPIIKKVGSAATAEKKKDSSSATTTTTTTTAVATNES